MLKEFWAVTVTSVYHALIYGKGSPELTKIAMGWKWGSRIAVGGKISGGSGTMLSVHKQLTIFIPEGGGTASFQREIGLVNTRYWLGGTSNVVALFLNKEAALLCGAAKDYKPCDERWRDETIETLRAIGKEHPYCSISTSPVNQLVDPKDWQ